MQKERSRRSCVCGSGLDETKAREGFFLGMAGSGCSENDRSLRSHRSGRWSERGLPGQHQTLHRVRCYQRAAGAFTGLTASIRIFSPAANCTDGNPSRHPERIPALYQQKTIVRFLSHGRHRPSRAFLHYHGAAASLGFRGMRHTARPLFPALFFRAG